MEFEAFTHYRNSRQDSTCMTLACTSSSPSTFSLPAEVWERVFTYLCHKALQDVHHDSYTISQALQALRLVNKTWNITVVNCSFLWASIYVGYGTSTAAKTAHARRTLTRAVNMSRNSPIHIAIQTNTGNISWLTYSGTFSTVVFRSLETSFSRIATIDLSLGARGCDVLLNHLPSMPNLKEISIICQDHWDQTSISKTSSERLQAGLVDYPRPRSITLFGVPAWILGMFHVGSTTYLSVTGNEDTSGLTDITDALVQATQLKEVQWIDRPPAALATLVTRLVREGSILETESLVVSGNQVRMFANSSRLRHLRVRAWIYRTGVEFPWWRDIFHIFPAQLRSLQISWTLPVSRIAEFIVAIDGLPLLALAVHVHNQDVDILLPNLPNIPYLYLGIEVDVRMERPLDDQRVRCITDHLERSPWVENCRGQLVAVILPERGLYMTPMMSRAKAKVTYGYHLRDVKCKSHRLKRPGRAWELASFYEPRMELVARAHDAQDEAFFSSSFFDRYIGELPSQKVYGPSRC